MLSTVRWPSSGPALGAATLGSQRCVLTGVASKTDANLGHAAIDV
jgi:hypothetical protein